MPSGTIETVRVYRHEFRIYLIQLLLGENDDTVGGPCEELVRSPEKLASLDGAVITVKDVAVECVNDSHTSRPADQRAPGQPSINGSRDAAERSRLGGVGVNDVRFFRFYSAIEL